MRAAARLEQAIERDPWRITLAASLVAVLPFIVGFLSSLHWLLTDSKAMPGWVEAARLWALWLSTIAVFAWFGAGRRERILLSTIAVVVLAWVLSAVMGLASRFLISLVADTVEVWQLPGLPALGLTAARAAIGVALGVASRSRGSANGTMVSTGGS